jgi:hypothetical protein
MYFQEYFSGLPGVVIRYYGNLLSDFPDMRKIGVGTHYCLIAAEDCFTGYLLKKIGFI